MALRGQGARRHLRGEWSAYEDDGRNNPVPDLIVLDLSLPDVSGFDVLRWISRRDALKNIPVIVFTASTDPEHARMAAEFGVRRYLEKPTHLGDLVATIKEEFRDRGRAPSPRRGKRCRNEPSAASPRIDIVSIFL